MQPADTPLAEDIFSNRRCPFQHLSTKHLAAKGVQFDLQEASRSNIGRARELAKFADYVCKQSAVPILRNSSSFDDVGRVASALNPHAPATLSEVLPIGYDRSIEATWMRVASSGSVLTGLLAMRHSEVFSVTGSHPLTAKQVLREIGAGDNAEVLRHFAARDLFAEMEPDEGSQDRLRLDARDAEAILSYQLIQERWQTRSEIDALNDLLAERQELITFVLGMQLTICGLLERYFSESPHLLDTSLAFGEIGLLTEAGGVVPSSRLLKVFFHNLGPWLLQNSKLPTKDAIVGSLSEARQDHVFEQYIAVLRKCGQSVLLWNVERKICPAKTALLRIMKHVSKQWE
jgi:hypothetical protein